MAANRLLRNPSRNTGVLSEVVGVFNLALEDDGLASVVVGIESLDLLPEGGELNIRQPFERVILISRLERDRVKEHSAGFEHDLLVVFVQPFHLVFECEVDGETVPTGRVLHSRFGFHNLHLLDGGSDSPGKHFLAAVDLGEVNIVEMLNDVDVFVHNYLLCFLVCLFLLRFSSR